MIEMPLTAFKLGMGDEVWAKKEIFLKKISVYEQKKS